MGYGGRGSTSDKSRVWDGVKWVETASGLVVPHDTTHSPVALYQLDELLTDVSGNALTTLTTGAGTARYTSIAPGLKGVMFDGSTYHYVNAAEASLVITGDLTIELVAIPMAIGSTMSLIQHSASGETEATNTLYHLFLTSGYALGYDAEQGAGVNITYNINDCVGLGVPVHIALVRSSNNITFYANGRKIGATSTGLSAPTGGASGRLYVGDNAVASGKFTGAIGSVKIINSALTADEIAAEYNRTLGSAGGEITWTNQYAMEFNGSDEFLEGGDFLNFEYNVPFSVSCWFKTSTAGNHVLVSKQQTNAPHHGWLLWQDTPGYISFTMTNTITTNELYVYSPVSSYHDGNWHHVVATYDGSTDASGADLYIDGADIGSVTYRDSLSASIATTDSFEIARRNPAGVQYYFAGKVDEVSVYDKQLSAAEVAAIWNGGKPTDLSRLSSESSMLGWWRMGDKASLPHVYDQSGQDYNLTAINMDSTAIVTDTPG